MFVRSRRRGFTLVEMLVVISIVGLLAGLTLTGITTARKNARDAERKSDLAQYRAALEAFAANNDGNYPSRTTSVVASTTLCSDLEDYFGSTDGCPADPSETTDYNYISDGSGAGVADAQIWILSATLEAGDYWENCSIGKAGGVSSAPTDEVCDVGEEGESEVD